MTRKLIATGVMILAMLVTSVTAFAASQYKTPAEVVAGITGKTVESVITERAETGKTYRTIASEAGKLDEFKAEMLEMKKDALAEQVAAGKITQAQADAIIKTIEENQAVCDGTGAAGIGRNMGAGFGCGGTGLGTGGANRGTGAGRGQGGGRGVGAGGMRLQDGSCYTGQ